MQLIVGNNWISFKALDFWHVSFFSSLFLITFWLLCSTWGIRINHLHGKSLPLNFNLIREGPCETSATYNGVIFKEQPLLERLRISTNLTSSWGDNYDRDPLVSSLKVRASLREWEGIKPSLIHAAFWVEMWVWTCFHNGRWLYSDILGATN